ncbi:MAG: hypothetical protein M3680_04560 [Myxococcota bacterium]|nr:hypothetical protein [Myxococcota bacterium]
MLRLAASLDELDREAGPVGRALVGGSFLTWCATPRLVGTVHFGRRETGDAHTLTRLYGLAEHPALRPPLRRVVDGRALTGIDDDAWTQMMQAIAPHASKLRTLFERQAVLVESSVHGARHAALLPAFGPGDTFRVFTDPEAAYQWADPADGPAAQQAVQALLDELDTAGDVKLRARAWVAGHLRGARIDACAGALGVSTRSLQRQLAAARLTFRDIVAAERVAAAQARLSEGSAKIEAIAREVGCSSASQLGVLLRRAGLGSPSALRSPRSRR